MTTVQIPGLLFSYPRSKDLVIVGQSLSAREDISGEGVLAAQTDLLIGSGAEIDIDEVAHDPNISFR